MPENTYTHEAGFNFTVIILLKYKGDLNVIEISITVRSLFTVNLKDMYYTWV